MILDAVQKGCRKFIIGIGGSATTEGGIGMLSALGYDFMDENGDRLPPVFASLEKVVQIENNRVPEVLKDCHFQIACDVTNPLCGVEGCGHRRSRRAWVCVSVGTFKRGTEAGNRHCS